jgi:hypothetical protein
MVSFLLFYNNKNMFYKTKKIYFNSLLIQESLFRFYKKVNIPTMNYQTHLDVWLVVLSCLLLGYGLIHIMFVPFGYVLLDWLLFPVNCLLYEFSIPQIVFLYKPLSLTFWALSISLIVCLYSLRFNFTLYKEFRILLLIEYGITEKLFVSFSKKYYSFYFSICLLLLIFWCVFPKLGLVCLWLLPFFCEYYCLHYIVNCFFKNNKFFDTTIATLISVEYDSLTKKLPLFSETDVEFFDITNEKELMSWINVAPSDAPVSEFFEEDKELPEFQELDFFEDAEDDFWGEEDLIYGTQQFDFDINFLELGIQRQAGFATYLPVSFYPGVFGKFPENYIDYLQQLQIPSGYTNYYSKFLFNFEKPLSKVANLTRLEFENDNKRIQGLFSTMDIIYDQYFSADLIESDREMLDDLINETLREEHMGKEEPLHFTSFLAEELKEETIFGNDLELDDTELGLGTEYNAPNWFLIYFCYYTVIFWTLLNILLFVFLLCFGLPRDWLDLGREPDVVGLFTIPEILLNNTEILYTDWGFTELPYGKWCRKDYFTYIQPAFFTRDYCIMSTDMPIIRSSQKFVSFELFLGKSSLREDIDAVEDVYVPYLDLDDEFYDYDDEFDVKDTLHEDYIGCVEDISNFCLNSNYFIEKDHKVTMFYKMVEKFF